MGNASHVAKKFPDIKRYFWLISTASGKAEWAKGQIEDIHGLTLNTYASNYQIRSPAGRCMVIRNADFLDEKDFYPVDVDEQYDLFFNSALWKVKRHELFLSTLEQIRNRYHRELKAAVILWTGPPRLGNSRIYSRSFYRLTRLLMSENEGRRYASRLRRLYEKAIEKGFRIDIIDPMYRWKTDTVPKLRLLYNKSKIYLLLSQNEGLNRAAKEALLCDTPILAIKGSTTAEEFINGSTGKAVEDSQEAIASGIVEMLDQRDSYSPRSWVLQNCPRVRICERLWNKINELERYAGYPSIDEANRIRRRFTTRQLDNYVDLNGWKGVGSRGSLKDEMARIRQTFKAFVGA
jgi:glycosyltransferase involved in cell wall biosynthesis